MDKIALRVVDLLKIFERYFISLNYKGCFAFFVFILRIAELKHAEKPVALKALGDSLAAEMGYSSYMALDSKIRSAISELHEASPGELAQLGIFPKRRTIPGLAEALAEFLLNGS